MNNELLDLKPTALWKNFAEICNIPHPSGYSEEITDFLLNFGKKNGLDVKVDEAGNVIIKKPATKGRENCKGVILQSHFDMVPQKNSATVHDFQKDPIITKIVDGWVTAEGTTLGADNGVGMATALAILESDTISHGPLEAL